nr:sestrin-3-like isoform X2 [Rhipicephalus microplus]
MILPCRNNSPLHDTSNHTMGQMGIRNTQVLFIDALCQSSHLDLLMGYHSAYQGPFLKTQNFILKSDGPLPYDQRHYIAIMKLTKGKNNWSLSEVVQAIVILAHFHALSSFVFGCGINTDMEEETNGTAVYSANGDSGVPAMKNGHTTVETIMQRMKNISEKRYNELTLEERARCFNTECNGGELLAARRSVPKSDLSQFITDPDFGYQDFSRRGVSEIPTFRIQDYSWEDHGYSLVNRLYNDVGELLNEKFKVAYNLTYYTMGSKTNVDTSMFRRAVWNYIQCIYGIRHDDYDYREVNELLDRDLKEYIKAVCCYPDRMTKEDYDNVMREFKYAEKVHVTIMILEARMQAELLYALRALMRYMT